MLANRVKETTSTTGTGSFTTTGAVAGFQTFNTAYGTNKRFNYWAVNDTDSEWETGIGYLSAATTLVRETVLDNSSDGATAINFTTAPSLFCTSSEITAPSIGLAQSNKWITPKNHTHTGYRAEYVIPADTVIYLPVFFYVANEFDNIRLSVTTAAGTKMRIGLYENDNGIPGDLIAETSDLSPATTGIKSATFTQGRYGGRWLFAAIVSDGATGVAAQDDAQVDCGPLAMTSADTYKVTVLSEAATSWTALPSSAGTLTELDRKNPPRISLQTV